MEVRFSIFMMEVPNLAGNRRYGLCAGFHSTLARASISDVQSLFSSYTKPPGGFGWILGYTLATLI
jgi:hypothetical protein